jgi:sugar lactone lactonase YvrE
MGSSVRGRSAIAGASCCLALCLSALAACDGGSHDADPARPSGRADAAAAVDAARAPASDAAVDATRAQPPGRTAATLFWLDVFANTVTRANADGSEATAFASGAGISAPDGVIVDVEGGYVYWSNMGTLLGGAELGTVARKPLEGGDVETIVPAGVGDTFKQITLDRENAKLYWCDREGAKVFRADLDGADPEIVISGHGFQQLIGVAVDPGEQHIYFSDRNAKKILRIGLEMPAGQTHEDRDDLEELLVFGGNAMPIDLDLDLEQRMIYWTDRALGTVSRAPMDPPAGQSPDSRDDATTLVSGLVEPIGIALDPEDGVMYYGGLGGYLERARLDGRERSELVSSGAITGVAFAELPVR